MRRWARVPILDFGRVRREAIRVTSPRRVGAETSETRATLLDRAEEVMLDEGYAAVTYRHLAFVRRSDGAACSVLLSH